MSSEKGFQLEEFGDASNGSGPGIWDLGEVTISDSLKPSEVGLGAISSAASAVVDASLTSSFVSYLALWLTQCGTAKGLQRSPSADKISEGATVAGHYFCSC